MKPLPLGPAKVEIGRSERVTRVAQSRYDRATAGARLVTLPLKKVVVGDRARKNVGNVSGLAESIERLGLLHPLVVNSRHELIAGGRAVTPRRTGTTSSYLP